MITIPLAIFLLLVYYGWIVAIPMLLVSTGLRFALRKVDIKQTWLKFLCLTCLVFLSSFGLLLLVGSGVFHALRYLNHN